MARGAIHYYRVAAVDKAGIEGEPSLLARTQPRALDHAVASVLGERQVELTWQPSPHADVVGYHVERADVQVYTTAQLTQMAMQDRAKSDAPPIGAIQAIGPFKRLTDKPLAATTYTDGTVNLAALAGGRPDLAGKPLFETRLPGDRIVADGRPYRFRVYAYRVRAVNALGVESGPSPFFLTIPEAVEDLFSKEDNEKVHLKWSASPQKKLRGYLVYRMANRWGKRFGCLTPKPIAGTQFTDDSAGGGVTRRYFIVAVDMLGQEGVPSSPVWSYREKMRFYKPFGAGVGTWHQ